MQGRKHARIDTGKTRSAGMGAACMSATLVLRAELANDPLGRGYSSMTDNQVVESINQPNRPAPLRPIPSSDLLGWSSGGANSGLSTTLARNQRLQAAARDSRAPKSAGIAEAALVLLQIDSELDVVRYATQIAALVLGGVLTQSESDELTALATVPDISRAIELGIGYVGRGLAINARR